MGKGYLILFVQLKKWVNSLAEILPSNHFYLMSLDNRVYEI